MAIIQLADETHLNFILNELKSDPAANGLAIQDLLRFPQSTQLFFTEEPFSYLHLSGHPAYHGSKVLSLGGDPSHATALLNKANLKSPFTIRETDSRFAAAVKEYYSSAIVYDEFRMDLCRDNYRPQHHGIARQLNDADIEALTEFFGAPKQAVERFRGWLQGARAIFGVFIEGKLASVGSTFITVPEVWNLVGIETKAKFRQRGFATEVTSSLAARAFEETDLVTLTVLSDNMPAIKTYEKLGFLKSGNRVWIDCGAGSKP